MKGKYFYSDKADSLSLRGREDYYWITTSPDLNEAEIDCYDAYNKALVNLPESVGWSLRTLYLVGVVVLVENGAQCEEVKSAVGPKKAAHARMTTPVEKLLRWRYPFSGDLV